MHFEVVAAAPGQGGGRNRGGRGGGQGRQQDEVAMSVVRLPPGTLETTRSIAEELRGFVTKAASKQSRMDRGGGHNKEHALLGRISYEQEAAPAAAAPATTPAAAPAGGEEEPAAAAKPAAVRKPSPMTAYFGSADVGTASADAAALAAASGHDAPVILSLGDELDVGEEVSFSLELDLIKNMKSAKKVTAVWREATVYSVGISSGTLDSFPPIAGADSGLRFSQDQVALVRGAPRLISGERVKYVLCRDVGMKGDTTLGGRRLERVGDAPPAEAVEAAYAQAEAKEREERDKRKEEKRIRMNMPRQVCVLPVPLLLRAAAACRALLC